MTETDFADFYTVHFRRLAAQLYAYLGDHAEAQDMAQEAFCRALDRWKTVSRFDDPAGWVRRVAWNLATSRLRHLNVVRRHLAGQRLEHVDGPTPDRVAIVEALAKLPPRHRLAVVLHHLGQLSTAEIAQQQGVAEGTVRSWLSRGRAGLAAQFEDSLTTVDIPAPGADAAAGTVRRRRTARRAALAAALVVVIAIPTVILLHGRGSEPPVIGPTPSPAPSASPSPTTAPQAISACTGRYLPLPQGKSSGHLAGGDSTGRYLVGAAGNAGDNEVPVLWDGDQVGTMTFPGKVLTGIAVNSSAVVAGSSSDDHQGTFRVWTWREGELTVLRETADPQQALSVLDVNNRGDILLAAAPGPNNLNPVVWEAGTGGIRELPRPDGVVRAFAYDLSDDGTAVGWDGESRALVWTADGAVRALPGPQGLKVSAIAINGPWVVGAAAQPQGLDLPGPGQHAIRWDLRTGDYVEIPDILLAAGVTPHGWMLAHTRVEIKDSTTRSRFLHPPVVQMPGKRIALPSPAGANQDDAGAQVVSDDGRTIAGEGKLPGSGHGTVIRWTCS